MDIRNQYQQFYKPKTYQVPRYYQNTQKTSSSLTKKKFPQRKTYIDQICKLTKDIPGPSQYSPINPETNNKNPEKTKLNVYKDRKSYLDQVINRAKSVPDIGKYNLQTNNNQKIKIKYRLLTKIEKEKSLKFKPSIFESISRDNLRVGPGIYNSIQTSSSPKYSIMPEHKKSKSLPKIPSPQQYNPLPSNFSTFDKISSISKFRQQSGRISTFGSRSKIKNLVNSPGPIYSLISEWCPKKYDRNSFNLFKSVSQGLSSSQNVYRN